MEASPSLAILDALLERVEAELPGLGHVPADLLAASRQVERLAGVVVQLAEAQAQAAAGRRHGPPRITAALVRSLLRARRRRADFLGADVRDAGWTLLLVAYAARLEGRRLSPARLAEASGRAQTSTQRWLQRLCELRLLTREPNPRDERGVLIGMGDEAAARVEAYLEAALRVAPTVL